MRNADLAPTAGRATVLAHNLRPGDQVVDLHGYAWGILAVATKVDSRELAFRLEHLGKRHQITLTLHRTNSVILGSHPDVQLRAYAGRA